jgi:hypothetical protein
MNFELCGCGRHVRCGDVPVLRGGVATLFCDTDVAALATASCAMNGYGGPPPENPDNGGQPSVDAGTG